MSRAPVRGRDGRAGADLAVIVAIATVVAAVGMHLRLVDRLVEAVDPTASIDLNGLVALAVLAPVAASVFALRRYRDAMRVRAELARLSLRDGLTGLPNRLYLTEWLDQELTLTRRAGSRVAILFVDCDRFKVVNDTHGHEVGDAVLVALARRLEACMIDDSDRVVRYAGDEFIVVCHDDPLRPAATIRLARRILTALDEPFEVGTESLRVSASIGVAVSDGAILAEDLIRRADSAMYDAKGRGDGRPVVYDEKVHGRSFSPAILEPQLRRAHEQGEFRLVYQPVVDTPTGQMVAVETLVRWEHPERGMVSPAEFIPVLEESGLIVEVGAWILQEALRQAHEWNEANPNRPPLRVTVNVSARQLAQSGFEQTVRSALLATPVPPGSVCLEITEGALMVDIDAAWSTLRLLKRMGIKLALDDFGTGYSSLSYIRRFSLDMLKIDRSFVEGLGQSAEDTAIVEHVIGMARALGMVTVGEGIETPQQLAELHRLGCDLAQGYLLSRPVAPAEISALLRRGGSLGRPDPAHLAAADDAPAAPARRPLLGARPFDALDRPPDAAAVGAPA